MLRSDESNIIESILGKTPIKKKSYFERINFGCVKKDPFEGQGGSGIEDGRGGGQAAQR